MLGPLHGSPEVGREGGLFPTELPAPKRSVLPLATVAPLDPGNVHCPTQSSSFTTSLQAQAAPGFPGLTTDF